MDPISLAKPNLSEQSRRILCSVARDSISFGLETGGPLSLESSQYPEELRQIRASFVTLHHREQLRGCIGAIEATRSVVVDVAEHAFAAAFRDPRFGPLSQTELHEILIHISILSPSERIEFSSERDLLNHIQSGIDGLVLKAGRRRATLLPSVWSSLPNPTDFFTQLKLKAGLPADYWSEEIIVERYTTESFSEQDLGNSD